MAYHCRRGVRTISWTTLEGVVIQPHVIMYPFEAGRCTARGR